MTQKIYAALLCYIHLAVYLSSFLSAMQRPKIWLAIWPLVVRAAISSPVLRQKLDI